MTWESLIPTCAVIGLAALGGFGGYMTLRGSLQAESRETARRLTEIDADRKELRTRLDIIDREGVRRADLAVVKNEIVERLKEVEHTFRGVQATAIGEMRDMVKALLDRALGAKP